MASMAKRIFLFLTVNFLIITTLSLVINLVGANNWLSSNGIDYRSLLMFCLIWGMGGSFISLLLSKYIVKFSMGVQVISPDTRNPDLVNLMQTVARLSRDAGLTKTPEVGYYESQDLNAFATGATKNSSLVAVSSGLLNRMNQDELEGVLGHEIAHIANGDMVTMTLLQGVVNAFAMFASRVITFAIRNAMRRDDDDRGGSPFIYYFVQMAIEMVFMFLGMIVIAWFSRWREFRADAGGAKLAGRSNMISALARLRAEYESQTTVSETPQTVQALQISSHKGGFLKLFSTHPPLEDRIARLRENLG
jgi:heat shock protein HtpX